MADRKPAGAKALNISSNRWRNGVDSGQGETQEAADEGLSDGTAASSDEQRADAVSPYGRRSAAIGVSFGDVERAVRVCLAHLVAVASAVASPQKGYELVAGAHTRRWLRRIRIPVVVEVDSARDPRHGTIAHLRWRAQRHRRVFPVMEADLVAHPLADGRSELVLAGTYQPPLGFLGLVVDLVVGRVIAQSTAEAFIGELSQAIETAVVEDSCAAPTTALKDDSEKGGLSHGRSIPA